MKRNFEFEFYGSAGKKMRSRKKQSNDHHNGAQRKTNYNISYLNRKHNADETLQKITISTKYKASKLLQ